MAELHKKTQEINKFFIKVLKVIKFLIICFAILYIGVIIGYSVIGNGRIIDAIDLTAVKHIIDIIKN
ncbi:MULTISPECIES: DNA-directed RNA polymerase subunit beta [unclassified Gemella]|uniref:DNA-directed RNA polymerase subunit beta n=1 Tax=unclassified Gemella TaxID=2624949 RepID=UPI001C0523ED|nr:MULTISPECIES: DNA-directed RNA polymerase subunit beta [unclassified Gemella]MBU0278622.1 DNA-directed RNA polymerase subunit beta [Gemella sp. zg-1178]QWQ38255.1 DNA-directed RNA polymerase subunit beta [Gemella sp. zg-570]